eukprot:TRINITY_DN18626_c1_g1_i1.p5 TRINITY_DN18626_c1_g1~~TRINITY_DN18626_c1_g1_i1.p5  ORF type:complete len:115 (-),score=6.92 TRINITY_DN18626_c1_g1_i1:57-401(-)
MRTIAVIVGAGALALAAGTANAGPVGIYAYNAKGKTAKAGKYTRWTRIYKPVQFAKLRAKTKKQYAGKMTLCQKPYHVRAVHKRWLAAHKKAKHTIVVRERVAKGKYKKLCDVK